MNAIKPGPLWLATAGPARAAMLPACMGGWCTQRDHCERHVTQKRDFVVERLCTAGFEVPIPVIVTAEEAA